MVGAHPLEFGQFVDHTSRHPRSLTVGAEIDYFAEEFASVDRLCEGGLVGTPSRNSMRRGASTPHESNASNTRASRRRSFLMMGSDSATPGSKVAAIFVDSCRLTKYFITLVCRVADGTMRPAGD